MNATDREIGARIREARNARGMTQDDLAAAVGVSDKAISSWETARSLPAAYYLRDICAALGVSADWVLFGEDEQWRDR